MSECTGTVRQGPLCYNDDDMCDFQVKCIEGSDEINCLGLYTIYKISDGFMKIRLLRRWMLCHFYFWPVHRKRTLFKIVEKYI